MPKLRWGVVVLAGSGVLCAAALSVPALRQGLVSVIPTSVHVPRRRLFADGVVLPPREIATQATGPKVPGSVPASAEAVKEGRPAGSESNAPPGPTVADTDANAPLVRRAIDAYRRGDLAAGDALERTVGGAIAPLTIEWTALRLQSHAVGVQRLEAFAAAHPTWPALPWLKRRIEEAMAADKTDPARDAAWLSGAHLETVAGKVALARLRQTQGDGGRARDAIREIWRDEDLVPFQEGFISSQFGDVIDRSDHWAKAERLLYKEQVPAALKEAAAAGPDVLLLAKARAAVIANAPSDAAIAAVPKTLQGDPGLIYSRIQKARRANKIDDAAKLLLSATRDPAKLIDGDAWWVERRLVARKLLDSGDPRRAYQICADHSASSNPMQVEAEFHAGWIALRFLEDARLAADHFARAAALAETPMSRSRAAYWQARAADAGGHPDEAARFYRLAAEYPTFFYGQLAAAKIGRTDVSLRGPVAATGNNRTEAVRVGEYLFALGARDIALPLALDIARAEPSDAQVAAMAAVTERMRDAPATLMIGKAATQRGMPLDSSAFPTFGIPEFRPLPNSADLAVVYAIARQESEFDPHSASSAGAKGLMQMISSTARRTAERNGLAYDDGRLAADPAFNAQLGAAHLGALLGEQGGSYVLAFAAYNAGGKNVKDWIDAYGDPRKPGIDPVDWIERIPFTETRNYVQRVLEGLQIYRAELGRPAPPLSLVVASAPPGNGT